MIDALANTPIPTILVVAGVAFLFLAIGGQLGATVISDRIRKGPAALLGTMLLVSGVALFMIGSGTVPRGDNPAVPEDPPDKPAPQVRTRTFQAPTAGGRRLDWCLRWEHDCGRPAADAWCRQQGFSVAAQFQIEEDIGGHSPTQTLSDGRLCDLPSCDGFASIECAR